MEGGSANDYEYVSGDPVDGFDLNGLAPSCRSNRSLCERYRAIQDNFASGVPGAAVPVGNLVPH